MKKNKFTLFAFFLDKRANHPEKEEFKFRKEEVEFNKLVFFWDQCSPKEETEINIWSKIQRKKIEGPTLMTSANKKQQITWFKRVRYATVAASIILLIGVPCFLLKNKEKRSNLEEIAQILQTETPQCVKEVTLIVSDKKRIELRNNAQVVYSKGGNVQIDLNKLAEADTEEVFNQIIVPKGKKSQIVLADNSKIWINSGSKVIYPRLFKGKYREIFVEGEVYLKVSHNAEKPFIVNTSGFEVRVLGTSFNISAHKGSAKASVVLVEGAVDVKDQNERHIKMIPNERVELNQARISGKEKVNALDYVSWIDGVWIIRGETLATVLQRLQEYYGQTIQCDELVKNEQIFGKLYLNNDLSQVMNVLLSTLSIQYTIKDNVIYVNHK